MITLPTSPAAWVRVGDRVLLPKATRYVRIVNVEYAVSDIRDIRVTYADINTGKGIRTRSIRRNARVILYPEGI